MTCTIEQRLASSRKRYYVAYQIRESDGEIKDTRDGPYMMSGQAERRIVTIMNTTTGRVVEGTAELIEETA